MAVGTLTHLHEDSPLSPPFTRLNTTSWEPMIYIEVFLEVVSAKRLSFFDLHTIICSCGVFFVMELARLRGTAL